MRRNQLNGSGGTAPLTYALVSGGNAATAGTFGTIQVNSRRQLRLHADQPFDTTPDADNGANTEVAESFTYVVTDANGNTRDRHHHGQHRRRRSDGARPTPTA